MDEVIRILMHRDGIDRTEAKSMIQNFLSDAEDAINTGDCEVVEELLMDDLGLDPDYIPQLLGLF